MKLFTTASTKVLLNSCKNWTLWSFVFASCLTFSNCASLPESAPSNRMREAKRALEAKEIDKETYFRVLIRAHYEEGRVKFEQRRLLMARSYQSERLLDPPVHATLYKQLDDALDQGEISSEVYHDLRNNVRVLQSEWGMRRLEISRERFRWGYPR